MHRKNNYCTLHNRGAAVITAVLFFVVISTAIALALAPAILRDYKTSGDLSNSKGAYYLSESGLEDVIYRIKNAIPVSSTVTLTLGGNTAVTTTTAIDANTKTVAAAGSISTDTRKVNSGLTTEIIKSFMYGIWVGAGGVSLQNSSTVTGNLFSAGPVCGGGSTGATCTSGTGTNLVTGSVVSSGTSGTNGIIANIQNQGGSSMYAGAINFSNISGGAYCNTISSSSTSTCSALSTQTAAGLAITAQDVSNLETAASAGGSAVCSWNNGKLQYSISSSVNLGPLKIPCDLVINGAGSGSGPTINLQGPVWVTGNISISNNLTIRVDSTFVGQSMVMVADNPSNQVTSSQIQIENNNPAFVGAPGGNSWVMLLSENKDASQGGTNDAINLQNGVTGDVLLYSRLGDIMLLNTSTVTNITGYKVTLKNSANVTYTSALQNIAINSGPGGAWATQNWKLGQ